MNIARARARRLRGVTLAAVMAGLSNLGAASEISERMDKLARQVVDGYLIKHPGKTGETIAVLPFNCTEAMAKQRIGAAVAELLIQRLVTQGTFRVVERDQLRKVLEEQSLGMSGVIDTASATSVGRVVGANYLLVGSVDKLGSNYELNARLLDATTADIVATGGQEVAAQEFEQEAKPYLVLVPETQAIGLYLMGGGGPFSIAMLQAPFTVQGTRNGTAFAMTYDVEAHATNGKALGIGARYVPVQWLMLDANFQPTVWKFSYSVVVTPNNGTPAYSKTPSIEGTGGSFTAHWIHSLSSHWRVMAGPGLGYFNIGVTEDQSNDPQITYNSGGGKLYFSYGYTNGEFVGVRPFLDGGIEWRPQARIGWQLLGKVFLDSPKITLTQHVIGDNTGTFLEETVPIMTMTLPTVQLETSLAFYF